MNSWKEAINHLKIELEALSYFRDEMKEIAEFLKYNHPVGYDPSSTVFGNLNTMVEYYKDKIALMETRSLDE